MAAPKLTKAELEARGSLHGKYDYAKYRNKEKSNAPLPEFPRDLDTHVPEILDTYDLRQIILELPGYDPDHNSTGYHFDQNAAARVIAFFHYFLTFVQGQKAGDPFILSRHQIAILANLFGWRDQQNQRRYRECLYSVARGGGKSPFGAGVALYCLLMEEPGAEIYSCGGDIKQAAKCFWFVRQMVLRSPRLAPMHEAKIIRTYQKAITLNDSQSYKVLSSDADLSEGNRVNAVIFDELHVQKNRALYDSMKIGASKAPGSLFLSISTCGHNLNSVMYEVYDYAVRVRDPKRSDHINDPTFLPAIWQADADGKIDDPQQWRKAQPNLNISIMEDDVARECKRALAVPGYLNEFKTKCLNLWVEQASRWLSIEQWDRCNQESTVPDEELRRIPCHCAIDLSANRDLTCIGQYWPSLRLFKLHTWIPGEPDIGIREKEQLDHAPYRRWEKQGILTLIAGNTIQKEVIQTAAWKICQDYKVSQFVLDQWGAQDIYNFLKSRNVPVYGYRQNFQHYTQATLELDNMLANGTLNHLGDECLRYCAQNVCLKVDKLATMESRRPVKSENENLKVDAIIVLCMCIGSALMTPERGPSIYDTGQMVLI